MDLLEEEFVKALVQVKPEKSNPPNVLTVPVESPCQLKPLCWSVVHSLLVLAGVDRTFAFVQSSVATTCCVRRAEAARAAVNADLMMLVAGDKSANGSILVEARD